MKMLFLSKKKVLPFLLLFLVDFFIITGFAYAQEIVIAGNPAAPSISAEDIKRIYLGFVKALPDGTPVKLLIMKRVPEIFYSKVVGLSRKDFRTHWLIKALSGAGIPPREAEEDEIVSLIKSDKGAIGVISADRARKEGLKILLEIK